MTVELLTSRQVADALGISISRVAALARQGQLLPAYDAGHRRLFRRAEVERLARLRGERHRRGERVKPPAV